MRKEENRPFTFLFAYIYLCGSQERCVGFKNSGRKTNTFPLRKYLKCMFSAGNKEMLRGTRYVGQKCQSHNGVNSETEMQPYKWCASS